MKIRLFPFAAIAVVMASCSNEDVMELNPDPAGDALSFSIAVSHSRATETTVNNLGDFRVVAKGIHPHGEVYENFLIGDENGGLKATKQSGSINTWDLEQNVYWPTSITSAVFWAYTCSQTRATDNSPVLPKDVKFGFETNNNNTAKLTGFSPVRANVTETSADGYWNDGADQTDMLVAFKYQLRSDGATNVALDFKHALTQIDIKAQSKNKSENDHRIVKIKGAWFVRTKDTATLSAGFSTTKVDNIITGAEAKPVWKDFSFVDINKFSAYGSFYNTPRVLTKTSGAQDLLGSSLMLIPQSLEGWNRLPKAEKPDSEKSDTEYDNDGAYILLLCRVELEHDGDSHQEGDKIDDVVVKDGKHYHQQFPVNAENKFNSLEYGFVCVPVTYKLEMGKKYQFTLDICGAASGAGYYPPVLSEEIQKTLIPASNSFKPFDKAAGPVSIVPRPSTKNVGDEVLDGPIQFNVSVSKWLPEGENNWTPGDVEL